MMTGPISTWVDFPTIKTNTLSEEEIHSAATRLAEAGEIGKAFKKLKSDRNRVVPSIEVLQKLQSKFPEPGLPNLSNEEINSIYNFNGPNNDELEDHEASELESSIEKVIRKAKKLSAHGIDHFRYEHLFQLWAPNGAGPDCSKAFHFSYPQGDASKYSKRHSCNL